jgi:hypothetical protein
MAAFCRKPLRFSNFHLAIADCGVASSLPMSGAEATAIQTLARPPGISVAREASGLRRVYRRFLISDLRADRQNPRQS